MEHYSHIPRVRSFLEVPSLFGTRDRFCGRHVFHRLRSGEWFQDDSRFKHVIYCALYFQSGAAGDLTRGTDLWPGGWGPGLTSYRTAWFTCPRQDSEISSLFPRSWKKLQWLLITYNTERGFLSSSSSALDCLVFTSLSSHGSYYSLLHPWPKSRQATLSCVFLELLGDMPAPDLCSVCSVSLGPFTCFRPASLWKCQFTCHRLHETVFHRSVHFSRSVVSNSLRPHGLQHARPPCPSPTPGVYSNSCPLSQWCHPTITSSVIPSSSHLQSFPASGSFSSGSALHIRWPKYWSLNFSISPSNEYSGLISFGLTGLSKGLSRVFSNITVWKHQFFSAWPSLHSNSHIRRWLLEKV